MHPYLTRLGIRQEVQEFFAPYYGDEVGNLLFNYGDAAEQFGFAFHRIPVSENCWLAGNLNFNMVSRVLICSSAMEAISFYHFKYAVYPHSDNLLFLSLGMRPNTSQFRWISANLPGKEYFLVFGNSLLDKAAELKTAAALLKVPLIISVIADEVNIHFRLKEYVIPLTAFSLSSFEKLSGYRFKIKTARSKNGDSYFEQLKDAALNH
jgi:hypothetical protein